MCITGFRREAGHNCALLGFYAATFREKGPMFPETSVWNYHYKLHNNSEERMSATSVMGSVSEARQHVSLTFRGAGMARLQIADEGDGLQVWRVSGNSRGQPIRGGPQVWKLGEGLTPHRKNVTR